MAENKDGILGPLKGKIGPIVGSSWRGIPYIKTKPVRKKPPTEKELENRYIFAFTQKWLQPIREFLNLGFKNYSQKNYGVNAAKSFLYKYALTKDGMNSKIDPSLMQVSYGDLPMPENIQMEWEKLDENVAELRLTWDVPARDHKSDFSMYDQAMVVVYDPRQETEAEGILHGAFRNTGNETLIFNYSAENEYHVWIAFLSADRERQSHNLYMGVITENGQENLVDESALEEA